MQDDIDSTDAKVGFDTTEVTVVEGETVTLTTSLKNNLTLEDYHRYSQSFTISTQQGGGNATGESHIQRVPTTSGIVIHNCT